MKEMTQERLKHLLHYDPSAGEFRWAISDRNHRLGAIAGSWAPASGGVQLRVDGGRYKAHRLAWLHVTAVQ